MGCVASRIDKEERVQICKERKRLMKQLVVRRGEFANAQLAYLRALRNTGVTLRQFTESESLELENTSYGLRLPPSPPISLPPSPPPPPFSPDSRKSADNQKNEVTRNESIKLVEDDRDSSLPSIIPSSWSFLGDPFELSSLQYEEKSETVDPVVEEENWAETRTEFDEDDQEGEVVIRNTGNLIPQEQRQQHPIQKQPAVRFVDDNASTMTRSTKDTADMVVVSRRGKKTLEGIVKELDDCFLKASASGKEITVLMNVPKGDIYLRENLKENKRRRSNSAKVFSALSWGWSSKSTHFAKEAPEVSSASEPCKIEAQYFTLDKLYSAEQKLLKEVRGEEMIKLELEKKTMLLQKQEEEMHDLIKTEKTRSCVADLESDFREVQLSISNTYSSILKVIEAELHPQLVTLTSGLKNMWRTMYECHKVQNHISQQLNNLPDNLSIDLATEYHRQATAQLEREVASWHTSFCKLIESQKEYVKTLSKWIHLTDSLADNRQHSSCSSAILKLCEEWQLIFDRLPDKIASEAIKSLLSAILSITMQQAQEHHLQQKSDKLEKKLQKALFSVAEMEKKLECGSSVDAEDECSNLSPKNPVSIKRAKIEALKEQVDNEKTKYQNSVRFARVMTLNNLKIGLPTVFQALVGFSGVYAKALDALHSHGGPVVDCDASENTAS